MRTCRLSMWLVLVGLVVGMSAAVAKADGDPKGQLQAPGMGGTPGVDNSFSLAPFGETSPGCTFDGTNETCTFKNQSSDDWQWATITAGASIPCADINFTTTLFDNPVTCTNDPITGDPTITVSGVNYSPSVQALINGLPGQLATCADPNSPTCTITSLQTTDLSNPNVAPNCAPSGGYFPGVLIGCDFQFILGPGDDGTWPLDTPFSVVTPEPSTFGMLLTGLVGLPFAVRRRKPQISA
jgi:PEP-CTERM motif